MIDNSFDSLDLDEQIKAQALLTVPNQNKTNSMTRQYNDEVYYALLAKINSDPSNYKEAMLSKDKNQWQKAINSELDSMYKNEVWRLVDKPARLDEGAKTNIIDSRWIFKRKLEPNGDVKFKARLVIRGFKDLNKYELSETYAPVSRPPLVRTIFAIINKYDLEVCQLDVKTPFLKGAIDEEIYMHIPDGTRHNENERKNKVCKVEKALYGLRMSPKRWNDRFTAATEKLNLKNSDSEPCLFIWREKEKFLILLLYVDNIIIASNDVVKLQDVKSQLSKEFEMNILGEPKELLGISIRRDRKKQILELSQEKYIDRLLQRYGFEHSNPCKSPMVTSQVLSRKRKMREDDIDGEVNESRETEIHAPYREVVGCLLYLTGATRPDINYAVNILSRHQIAPTENECLIAKRILRYLKGTKKMAIRYAGETGDIQAYSDASFADFKGSLTTCGYAIKLFGDTIAWRTRKQQYVAMSTCQEEFVTMSDARQEMNSLHNSIKLVIGKSFYPMTLWCDNKTAKINAETSGGNKLRHMTETKENYVKECVKLKRIEINKLLLSS